MIIIRKQVGACFFMVRLEEKGRFYEQISSVWNYLIYTIIGTSSTKSLSTTHTIYSNRYDVATIIANL